MNTNDLILKINDEWQDFLCGEITKPYLADINEKIKQERTQHTIFPPANKIFSAYNHTPLKCLKVVIIGQDPYHGLGQANGLCFSVNKNTPLPPSLKNIYKELVNDLGIKYPNHGDLSSWAEQGVLLLNSTLTVREASANSHSHIGWQKFTDATIKLISQELEGIVFLLWGGYAKKKASLIDKTRHYLLTAGHPSPLSANRGFWFGNKHFSKTNEILLKIGKEPINWEI